MKGGLARLRRVCLLALILSCIAGLRDACWHRVRKELEKFHRVVQGEPPCPADCTCLVTVARGDVRAAACSRGDTLTVAVRRALIVDIIAALRRGAKPGEDEVDEAVNTLADIGAITAREDCRSALPEEICRLLEARKSHVYTLGLNTDEMARIADNCRRCIELVDLIDFYYPS